MSNFKALRLFLAALTLIPTLLFITSCSPAVVEVEVVIMVGEAFGAIVINYFREFCRI